MEIFSGDIRIVFEAFYGINLYHILETRIILSVVTLETFRVSLIHEIRCFRLSFKKFKSIF